MLIADTSGLLAAYNAEDTHHAAVTRFLSNRREQLILSPYVVGELDYMVTVRAGRVAAREMLGDLLSGAFELAVAGSQELGRAIEVIDQYPDQAIGLADASLVVLAKRYGTTDILTLDFRHFDVLRPLQGGRFRLMPRDWDGL